MNIESVGRQRPRFTWNRQATIVCCLLIIWFGVLCVVPDPRPLAAPESAVRALRSLTGIPESAARAVATIVLRAAGLGLLGLLTARFLAAWLGPRGGWWAVLIAPLLAIATLWINLGYFPITKHLMFASVCGLAGSLLGMAIWRNWVALAALAALAAGLFIWGTSTGIPDDLDRAARLVGSHLLDHVDEIPAGDDGFTELLRLAFLHAENDSHGRDPRFANRAAILALGTILGNQRVAQVAGRKVDGAAMKKAEGLRSRVTLRGRHDLPRHFWVSGALKVLADEKRAMAVGLSKELMDAQEGGSGFSFVDKAANMAGIRFAQIAVGSPESARELQRRIIGGMNSDDFCPDISGLPEGLTRDQFHAEYGGLAGSASRQLFEEIERRLASCPGLAPVQ